MIEVFTGHVAADVQYDHKDTSTITTYLPIRYIVAQPNRSASWQFNKLLIVALGLPCAVIATVFSLAGAWRLLPFAGLEITGIGAALYIVCKRLQNKHVLTFSGQTLLLEKGCGKPQQRWLFDTATLSIGVMRQAHPWDPLTICLYGQTPQGHYQQVPVGDFLNKHDSQKLLAALRKQGLPVRNDSKIHEITV